VPIGAFALATRSAGAVLRTDLICLGTDAILALALIPAIGLYGAVAANALSQVLSLLLMSEIVIRRLNVARSEVMSSARIFLAGPVIGIEAILVSSLLPLGPVVAAAVALLMGVATMRLALALIPSIKLHVADLETVLDRAPAPLARPMALMARLSGLASTGGAAARDETQL